jgi:hypothetical protein
MGCSSPERYRVLQVLFGDSTGLRGKFPGLQLLVVSIQGHHT